MHTANESEIQTIDGARLFYRSWSPSSSPAEMEKKAIILFHRGHEHSGRLAHLVRELDLPDFYFFAWDQRGHGKSTGERGYADSGMQLVRDIDQFIKHVSVKHGVSLENMFIIAHSVSAVLVANWLKSFAPPIRGLALVTPAFSVKLYIPLALPFIRLGQCLSKRFAKKQLFIKSYVTGKMLTHDKVFAESYDSDTLVSKQIAANILIDLFKLSKHILKDAGAIVAPTLVLSARADWVVKNLPQRKFFQALNSRVKRARVYRGMFHGLLHEQSRGVVLSEVRQFIQQVFSERLDYGFLKDADKAGYTNEEYQWLNSGVPMLSPTRLYYYLQRLGMLTFGKLSDGVSLGWRTGFDSGQTLDYVYRNSPSGKLWIGKLIDSVYLNAPGWVGIRQRGVNLQKLLIQAIDTVQKEGHSPVKIVDLAGGPGRYLINSLSNYSADSYSVLIRDWSEESLIEGRELAKSRDLKNIRFERGDAFLASAVKEIGRVDIAIVSGLYELFPDNGMVLESLKAISDIVRPGGYLIYTCQPWHPQLEMIAEVLVNRNKEPWIMRRRTQAEMDELVRNSGFSKVSMELDDEQIFTVSLSKKL